MGKIIIEIDEFTKNIFKSQVASEGRTIREVLTEMIEERIAVTLKKIRKAGGKK